MARIVGWRCDAPKCDNVCEDEKLCYPWIKVMPVVDDKLAPKDEGVLTVCSNKCLKALASERYEAAIQSGSEEAPYHRRKKLEQEASA